MVIMMICLNLDMRAVGQALLKNNFMKCRNSKMVLLTLKIVPSAPPLVVIRKSSMNYTPKTKKWFTARIGNKIFRDSQCLRDKKECCSTCKHVRENGLVVADEEHAEYLSMIDCDFAAKGIYSNYRDEK